MNIINKAVELKGGVGKLASAVGVSAPTVSQWLAGKRPVPAERVIAIAQATGWQITPHEIMPEIYPNAGDAMPHLPSEARHGRD